MCYIGHGKYSCLCRFIRDALAHVACVEYGIESVSCTVMYASLWGGTSNLKHTRICMFPVTLFCSLGGNSRHILTPPKEKTSL